MLTLEQAYKILDDKIGFWSNYETLAVNLSLGRVLAEDQYSLLDLPPFNKAAMDGYAILADDVSTEYRVIDTIMAGECPRHLLQIGTTAKVMTGAPLPLNATLVIPHEMARENNGIITFTQKPAVSNICLHGEDIRRGELVVKAPCFIEPLTIANLIASGISEIKVFKKLRVIIIATGNEIVNDLAAITFGKIMNSNGPLLVNLCQKYGLEVIDNVLLKDDYKLTRAKLQQSLNLADMVIFSAGVSAGDFDFVSQVLQHKEVKLHFNQVAIKPGKPTTFATVDNKLIFGLPGNPVAVYLTFHLFILRALRKLYGAHYKKYFYPLRMQFNRKNSERTEYVPGKLEKGTVVPISLHGSAHLHALLNADGFFVVPKDTVNLSAEQLVEFIPI